MLIMVCSIIWTIADTVWDMCCIASKVYALYSCHSKLTYSSVSILVVCLIALHCQYLWPLILYHFNLLLVSTTYLCESNAFYYICFSLALLMCLILGRSVTRPIGWNTWCCFTSTVCMHGTLYGVSKLSYILLSTCVLLVPIRCC